MQFCCLLVTHDTICFRDYNFLLPEYMVHEEVNDHANGCSFTPQRAPYGFDKTTVYERERDPTLKTVKLPEVSVPTFEVEFEYPLFSNVMNRYKLVFFKMLCTSICVDEVPVCDMGIYSVLISFFGGFFALQCTDFAKSIL